jgi:EmrB/QacA subfamily drug resistance transporter
MINRANQNVALWSATLASFITPFMGSAVNIALPSMGRELGMDAVQLSWVGTAYLLAAAAFLLPFGKAADLAGRKKIFSLGLALTAVSSVFCALAPSGGSLIMGRVLQGMGGAMVFSTGTAILFSVFPRGDRGRVLGITISATYLGLSLGPVLGGFLTQHLGWRSLFWVTVPLALGALILVLGKLKGEWAESAGQRFDSLGSLLYGLALAVLIYGFSRLPGKAGVLSIVLALAGLWLFVRWEERIGYPVLEIGLFRANRIFAFSSLAALINYSATFALTFILSLYLQYVKGLSPQQAGLILVCQPIMMAAFSPLAGSLSDRLSPRLLASAGMALDALGLFLLSFLQVETSNTLIILALLLIGFGFALFSSPNTHAVMGSVDKKFYGVASATLGTMRMTGQMLSMGLTLLVIALYLGKAKIAPGNFPQFMASSRTNFMIFSGLCLVGVFASLARGKGRPADSGPEDQLSVEKELRSA